MPTVPISTVTPEVQPSGQALPEVNVPISADAFGAAIGRGFGEVGQALRSAGSDIEHGAGDLFNETMRLQDLQNRTEVDKADASYMEQAGLIHAKFGAMRGEEQAAAYPQYIKDLQDARSKIRDGLSNPMVQKMYDSQTLSTMGRTIFNGAGMAATATREAAIDAAQSATGTAASRAITANNDDDAAFYRKKAIDSSNRLHQLKGTPESAADSEYKINSTITSGRIEDLAERDPWAAKKMLEEKRMAGEIDADDLSRAESKVRSQIRSIGSVNLAQEVWDANKGDDGMPTVSVDALEDQVRAKAKQQNPDDPLYEQHAVTAIQGLAIQKRRALTEFRHDNEATVSDAIQGGVKNIQELNADPRVAQAVKNLPPKEREGLPARINRYNAAASYQANQESMTRLDGLRLNDRDRFLDIDPTAEGLSQPQMRQVMQQQAQVRKEMSQNMDSSERIQSYMRDLRGSMGATLQSMGIYSRDAKNPDEYDKFTGQLYQAIDSWRQGHGKLPTSKDVTDTIAPQLMKQITSESAFGHRFGTGLFDTQTRYFDQTPSNDESQAIRDDVLRKKGIQLDDNEVYQIWQAQRFEALYGKSARGKGTSP